jgi:ATP-dependent RNA helicase DDX56/DBP9
MKHIPKYLMPRVVASAATATAAVAGAEEKNDDMASFVPFSKGREQRGRGRGRGRGGKFGGGSRSGRSGKKNTDPLRKFR